MQKLFNRLLGLSLFFLVITSISAKDLVMTHTLNDDNPVIIIHDTIVAPGELLLQIDAMNFVGSNGQIGAITLRIDVDTLLVEFISIQNTSLTGGWIGNYNIYQNEITINYTAPLGIGFDIDGKLLDLQLNYFGGFPAELNFKPGCEISNVNLQTIQDVIYENGLIEQIQPVGTIMQDTVIGVYNEQLEMPLIAFGSGYNMVDEIVLRVGYDPGYLVYDGYNESALTDVSITDDNSILTINWEDAASSIDFTSTDTLLFLNFTFIGDTNTSTVFLPGSYLFNNDTIVSTEFLDGTIKARTEVVLINQPDTAGTTLGSGYYFINDTVNAIAIPEPGFHFDNWTINGSVVSADSIYTYIKQWGIDTLTANYSPNSYNVNLLVTPILSGFVTGEGNYDYGELVTVTANPELGYEFIYWILDGEIVSVNNVYTFSMPYSDIELTATFSLMMFTITAVPNNPNFGSVLGGGEYSYGETVTLVATSEDGYDFIVWTEAGQPISYDSIYSFTVTSDRNMVANFEHITDCTVPVGLFVDNISETSAMLYWVASGSENEWNMLWGETGFDTLTGGNLIEGLTQTNYLLEGLDPGTYYDFYLRAICDENNVSNWSEVYSFSTWYVGTIKQDTVIGVYNEQFEMPLIAFGSGYNMVNEILLRIGYDHGYLIYNGYSESALTDVSITDNNSILTINWEDAVSSIDLTSLDTLLFLNFTFVGDSNTSTIFLPGSNIWNNDILASTEFLDGLVKARTEVVLINQPDTAGTTLGSGYYFINDTVNAIAIPEPGFHFDNWTISGSVVSTDSIYTYIKQWGTDILTANYSPNSYNVNLLVTPTSSGIVTGEGNYDYGEFVTVTASPELGYEFTSWILDNEIVSVNNVYTFPMPYNDVELTATFSLMMFTITAVPNNPNFGSVLGGGEYSYGETATLVATSEDGYDFIVWTEAGQAISYDSVYSFTVTSDRDMVANFEHITDCTVPVGLFVDNISETSAMLYWVASGSEDEWDMLWGETGFDTLTGGNLIGGISQTNYLLEGLNPGTYYDFYVRAICDENNVSNWSEVYSFSTWYVGADEKAFTIKAIIYPNPAYEFVNIQLSEKFTSHIQYMIVDLWGSVIYKGSLHNKTNEINISLLTPGVFAVIISSDKERIIYRMIKQ